MRPVLLGGRPEFINRIPLAQPTIDNVDQIGDEFKSILSSKILTSGSWVAAFERASASFLGVRHAVAVSSCSIGLMLVLRCLGVDGRIIMPSHTFCATGHSALWNGCEPLFCECESETMNIDVDHVRELISDEVAAVIGVHLYGTPCDVYRLERVCDEAGVPVIIDAAHAFGARINGEMVGRQGSAHVFSFSPTKVLTANEGGLITTDDHELAKKLRVARNYGHDGDYDCHIAGLNARMTEANALLAVSGLRCLTSNLRRRLKLVEIYKNRLEKIAGIGFQFVHSSDDSTYKDFTITINEQQFGINRDQLAKVLDTEGIETRRYFFPPLHEQKLYRSLGIGQVSLPVTEQVSKTVLTLPLYSHMKPDIVDKICDRIELAHIYSKELKPLLGSAVDGRRQDVGVSTAMSAIQEDAGGNSASGATRNDAL